MNAKVGWYIWELMITHQWGTVHDVFHPDGTVRDPSIVAALFGMFREPRRPPSARALKQSIKPKRMAAPPVNGNGGGATK